jgi:hypothetical protein
MVSSSAAAWPRLSSQAHAAKRIFFLILLLDFVD